MRAILLAGVAAFGLIGTARADVSYDFSAAFGSVIYDTPYFITSDITVPASNVSYFNFPNSPNSTFQSISFLPSCPSATDCNQINLHFSINSGHGSSTGYYYFPANAFSNDGVYHDIFGGPETLTVSGSPTVAVPEPASLALLTLPLGLAGLLAMRRRPRLA